MRDRGLLTITPNGPRGEQHARRFELRSLLHRVQLSTGTFTRRSNCEVRRAAEGAGTGTGLGLGLGRRASRAPHTTAVAVATAVSAHSRERQRSADGRAVPVAPRQEMPNLADHGLIGHGTRRLDAGVP